MDDRKRQLIEYKLGIIKLRLMMLETDIVELQRRLEVLSASYLMDALEEAHHRAKRTKSAVETAIIIWNRSQQEAPCPPPDATPPGLLPRPPSCRTPTLRNPRWS